MSLVKWSLLRTIGNSKIFNLTIIIPVIGYFILFNDEVVRNLEFSEAVIGSPVKEYRGLRDQTLFKLFCVYFGFYVLATGLILYYAFCPNLIKRYKTYVDYITAEIELVTEKKVRELRRLNAMLGGTNSFDFEALYSLLQYFLDVLHKEKPNEDQRSPEELAHQIENLRRERQLNINNLMSDVYENSDKSRPFARVLVFSLFVLGFTFLAIPSLMMFCQVLLRAIDLLTRLVPSV